MSDDLPAWPLSDPGLSYSYRETSRQVWRNRVGTTSALLGAGMALSFLLGKPRP